MQKDVVVIGGGLAGTEAAWQAASAGCSVALYEMRPALSTPAHHTEHLAELVCSNSFGAMAPDRATGLLQEELLRLGSIVIRAAQEVAVPAGGALAVDRARFSADLTTRVENHPNITLCREEITSIPEDSIVVIATGPLTSPAFSSHLLELTTAEYLSFYDAASPIVNGDSLDREIAFLASRYDRGEAAYLNCPMNEEEYTHFWQELCNAEDAPHKGFDRKDAKFFEGCLPIEELARRGKETMRFGPLKPVGLRDPRYPDKPCYAIVQLRMEDCAGQLWNLVGFQTNLKWGEQERVFKLIPGLQNATFVRKGVMHRNTFLNAPTLLNPTLQFKSNPKLLAAGQITGTEGYAAACAGGWLAGTNAARLALGKTPLTMPPETMLGALLHFITSANQKTFQPMPPNFGIFPPHEDRIKGKRNRAQKHSEKSLVSLQEWMIESNINGDVSLLS
jgi:methylenetetrahydrofolate--tRNA-(uracil-5-)-methyltransferase